VLFVLLRTVGSVFVYTIFNINSTCVGARFNSISVLHIRLAFFVDVFKSLELGVDPNSHWLIGLMSEYFSIFFVFQRIQPTDYRTTVFYFL